MATLNFQLTRPKAEKSGIYFLLNYGAFKINENGKKQYLPCKYYIDESIEPEFWDNGRAKRTKQFPSHVDFNIRLNQIEELALTTLRQIQNKGCAINNDILKIEFDKAFKKGKDFTSDKTTDLIAFAEYFAKNSKKKPATLINYRQAIDNLKEYEKISKKRIKLLEANFNFYQSFLEFLVDKNYAPNSVGTRIKNLRVFLNAAFLQNIPVCPDYRIDLGFEKPQEDVSNVYLTEAELQQMYWLDLSDKMMRNTRDLFLIGAYTGFRCSDLSTLDMKHFCPDNTIKKRTLKTNQDVVIPVHPMVREILNRRNFDIPKVSIQTFNELIKEVARLAGITTLFTYTKTKGNEIETLTEPKWKKVSSHTARRSFATNAYLQNIPPIAIMKMTGHKSESSFLKYIKISLAENAKTLQTHTFFTTEPIEPNVVSKKIAG